MTMQLLEDVTPIKLSLEEGDSGKIRITGPFGLCGTPTANKRLYSRPIIESNIKRLAEAMGNRRLFGELDHPSDGKTSLKRVSHIITNLAIEDDGTVTGTMEPLPTPMGKVLTALAEAGCELGVSSRGMGSTVTNKDGIDEVQDDFVLKTYDVVADPASKNAFPKVVKEAIEEAVQEYAKREAGGEVALDDLHADDRARLMAEASKLVHESIGLQEGSTLTESEHHDEMTEERETEAFMKGVKSTLRGLARPSGAKAAEWKLDDSSVAANNFKIGKTEFTVHGQWVEVKPKTGKGYSIWIRESNPKKRAETFVHWFKDGMDKKSPKLARVKEDVDPEVVADLEQQVERLKEAVAGNLIEQLEDLRESVRLEERAKLMADPEVAGAKAMVEAIAGIVRPLMVPERTREVLTDLRDQNVALSDALKDKSFQLSNSHMEMAQLQQETTKKLLGARLSEMIAGHPKADLIRTVIGPVERFESEQELVDRVEALFQEIGKPSEVLTAPQEDLTKQIEALTDKLSKAEARSDDLSSRLERAVQIGEQLQSEAEQAIEEADQAKVQVYAMRKVQGRPDASRILSLVESAESIEDVDAILKANPTRPVINEDEEAQKIRSRASRGIARSLEEEVTPRQGSGSGDTIFNQPVDEIARLAGLAPTR
jgi:hypothetical protein